MHKKKEEFKYLFSQLQNVFLKWNLLHIYVNEK